MRVYKTIAAVFAMVVFGAGGALCGQSQLFSVADDSVLFAELPPGIWATMHDPPQMQCVDRDGDGVCDTTGRLMGSLFETVTETQKHGLQVGAPIWGDGKRDEIVSVEIGPIKHNGQPPAPPAQQRVVGQLIETTTWQPVEKTESYNVTVWEPKTETRQRTVIQWEPVTTVQQQPVVAPAGKSRTSAHVRARVRVRNFGASRVGYFGDHWSHLTGEHGVPAAALAGLSQDELLTVRVNLHNGFGTGIDGWETAGSAFHRSPARTWSRSVVGTRRGMVRPLRAVGRAVGRLFTAPVRGVRGGVSAAGGG